MPFWVLLLAVFGVMILYRGVIKPYVVDRVEKFGLVETTLTILATVVFYFVVKPFAMWFQRVMLP